MVAKLLTDGTCTAFSCKFVLNFYDDGILRIYFHTKDGVYPVSARCPNVTKQQFTKLAREFGNRVQESAGSLDASDAACRTQFFDDCLEHVLCHRPARKSSAGSNAASAGPSQPHVHSPLSPASQQPAKRLARGNSTTRSLALPSTELEQMSLQRMSARPPELSGTRCTIGAEPFWLQCSADRCAQHPSLRTAALLLSCFMIVCFSSLSSQGSFVILYYTMARDGSTPACSIS